MAACRKLIRLQSRQHFDHTKEHTEMRIYAKFAITALVAAAALAAVVSSASARNLEVSNQFFRVTWSSLEFTAPLGNVLCPVTIEGSFHSRTIPKVERLLIGAITAAIVKEASCTNGSGRANTERLPFHVTYERFTGTLPNITSVTLLLDRAAFEITQAGNRCRFTTSATRGIATGRANREAGGAITTIDAGGTISRDAGNPIFCPETGRFTNRPGDGSVTVLAATERITVRLI